MLGIYLQPYLGKSTSPAEPRLGDAGFAQLLESSLPTLLLPPDGRAKRRRRLALVGSGDFTLPLPWLIVYTRRGDTRPRNAHPRSFGGG